MAVRPPPKPIGPGHPEPLSSRPQPGLGGGRGEGSGRRTPPNPSRPAFLPQSYLVFQGIGFTTLKSHAINVLCGENPPTITDGYAQWTTVNRPLARGISVFTGYNPAQMKCDVRFGRWNDAGWETDMLARAEDEVEGVSGAAARGVRRSFAGQAIEDDLKWMGWMAGEGFTAGPSPVVYVNAYHYPSGPLGLIPPQWQGPKVAWVITGLEWGLSYRNDWGDRIYQEATVTLLQYLNFANPPKEITQQRGGFFVVKKTGPNTPFAIASAPSSHSPLAYREQLAKSITTASQNKKLKLRPNQIHQKIKPGSRVFVPSHVYG